MLDARRVLRFTGSSNLLVVRIISVMMRAFTLCAGPSLAGLNHSRARMAAETEHHRQP